MLKELIQDGYGIKEDLNCAETILYGANRVYHLDLNSESLKLAAAFGGGMAIESVCGVLTASLMVLGKLFVPEVAHKYPEIKELSKELFDTFKKEMGDILCKPLKDNYRTEEKKCREVILKAAEVLDKIVTRELKNLSKNRPLTNFLNKMSNEYKIKKREEMMDKIIAFCGLSCSGCPAFIATQKDNNKEREKTAKAWSKMYKSDIKPEDINCDGCLEKSGRLFNYCKVCEIRKCGQEKEVKNCAYCDDYACEKLIKFFDMAPEAKTALIEIRKNL